jgi:hypothetical protein
MTGALCRYHIDPVAPKKDIADEAAFWSIDGDLSVPSPLSGNDARHDDSRCARGPNDVPLFLAAEISRKRWLIEQQASLYSE